MLNGHVKSQFAQLRAKSFIICLLPVIFLGACSRHEEAKTPPPLPPSNSVSAATNFALLVPPAPPASGPRTTIERDYAVGKHGVLHFAFPTAWHDTIKKVTEGYSEMDAIQFDPAEGGDFSILIEVIYVGAANMYKLDTKTTLAKAGQDELDHAVEKSLDIQDFSGQQASGSYFVVTDKSFSLLAEPEPGEYRYLMQGYVKLNGVVLTVRLVSNRIANQQPALLEMLKTARFATNSTTASPGAPTPH